MSKYHKLNVHQHEVLRFLQRHVSAYPWIDELVELVRQAVRANSDRAAAAKRQQHPYSRYLDKCIAMAIPRRLVGHPGAVQATLRKIEVAGPEAFGLRRKPAAETVRRVSKALAENPRLVLTESRIQRDWPLSSVLSSTASTT